VHEFGWGSRRNRRFRRDSEPVAAGPVALLVGSSGDVPALWAFRPPDRPEPVRLVPLPRSGLARCRRSPVLRSLCPRLVPEVERGRWLVEMSTRGGRTTLNLARGAESPERPEWNRPPAMAHVVLASASGGHACREREPLADGLLRRTRAHAVCFGPVTLGGRSGDLTLAPSFPHGGVVSDHLVFRWRERGRRYSLSLHAWEPLTEAATTLSRIAAALGRA
jgi:hypothetical protein